MVSANTPITTVMLTAKSFLFSLFKKKDKLFLYNISFKTVKNEEFKKKKIMFALAKPVSLSLARR